MINAINDKINRLRDEQRLNKILFALLFCIVLLVSVKNIYVDIFASIVLAIITFFLKPEEILYSYIFLFFFEPVTEISFLGGSINRIITVIGILRIVYCFLIEKTKIKKSYLLITIFLSCYLVYALYFNRNRFSENLILYGNIMFFVLYGNYLSSQKFFKKKKIINNLLQTIVYGVFGSIVYGFLFRNFDLEKRAGFTNLRFNGTNDPNFLAYYINLAIIVQMFKDKVSFNKEKILNYIINIALVISLILTKSITGIFINVISFICFIIIKNKSKVKNYIKLHKCRLLIVGLVLVLCLGLGTHFLVKRNINEVYVNDSGKVVAKNRIADVILSIKQGDIDRLTSQKTRDWRLFLNDYYDSEIIVILFGKGMQPANLYSSYWGRQVASHSTYIDFLWCYGLIGFIIIVAYLLHKTRRSVVLSSYLDNDVYKYIRIILLVYGLELGIYTNRIFLLIFLL